MRKWKSSIALTVLLTLTLVTFQINFASAERIDEGIFTFQAGEYVTEPMTCFDEQRTRELSEATTEGNLCMEELKNVEAPGVIRAKIFTSGIVGVGLGLLLSLAIHK